MQYYLIRNDMLSLESQLRLHLCTVSEDEKLLFIPTNLSTHPTHSHTTSLHFLQVIAQGGRKSGSVASYMGLVPGREEENRGERGGLFDLLAASVLEAEWSRWAPITSPSSLFSPPAGHTHEYNRWRWIQLWLCFQGVVFEVNGSIRLCFPWSFSGHQQTPIKILSIAQRAREKCCLQPCWNLVNLISLHEFYPKRCSLCK